MDSNQVKFTARNAPWWSQEGGNMPVVAPKCGDCTFWMPHSGMNAGECEKRPMDDYLHANNAKCPRFVGHAA